MCGAADVFCLKYQVDMHHLGVRCQVGVVDGFTNLAERLFFDCWCTVGCLGRHMVPALCGVGVVVPFCGLSSAF